MKCATCNNDLESRRIFEGNTGPMGRRKYGTEIYCPYCEWKGTTGPGAVLRDLIQDFNKERS